MAFYNQYPTTYGAFPAYTSFAPAAPAPQAADRASAHEGSQQGDAPTHSVSGFAAQPIDAGFGAPIYGAAPWFGGAATHAPYFGAATVIPGAAPATYLHAAAPTALVPFMAPQIRRPGYNERLVAWRNRQKAFNRYKRETKKAIKNANSWHQQHHNAVLQSTVLATPSYYSAAPVYGQTLISQPYGATYLAGAYPYAGAILPAAAEHSEAHENQYGDFSYSSAGAAAEQQHEEPEIRGTQV